MTAKKENPGAGGRRGLVRLHLLAGWVRLNSTTLAQIALCLLLTAAVVWQAVQS